VLESVSVPVLLYDGVCGLCNRTVQLILRFDKKKILRFASLQSEFGEQLKSKYPELKSVDSVVLVEPIAGNREQVSTRSTAILRIFSYLGGMWRLLLIGYLIPRPIRDFLYNLIAKNRYKIFGKYESCWLPSADTNDRFIDL
jgi:predicted DCC family thiol-disulfide oxidoreductase YuxK